MTEIGASRLSIDTIGGIDAERIREILPVWLGGFVDGGSQTIASVVDGVASALMQFEPDEVQRMVTRLETTGSAYEFYEADPVARTVIRAFVRGLVIDSSLKGAGGLVDAHKAGPVLLLSNHLSYCDAQITDLLLSDGGFPTQANQLIAVAGPKVYSTLFRRLAALGLGTIKTAQSSHLAHNETPLTPRQVADVAMGTVRLSHEYMDEGGMVVLYGEGSRSRVGRFGSFLRAVRRYARKDSLTIVPVALSGTNKMMPLDMPTMCPASVSVEFGSPIHVAEYGALDSIRMAWLQIAELLPAHLQPVSGCPPVA